MIDEDVIQYHVPAQTQILFVFESHQKEFHLNLINGAAKLCYGDKNLDLQQGHNVVVSLWNCLAPKLETATESEFEIQGSHYIPEAFIKIGRTNRVLFSVSQVPNGFVFVLDAAFQLQIFANPLKDSVKLKAVRGASEVLGRLLPVNQKFCLVAGSSTLVNSHDGNSYTVAVYGGKRRVEVSQLEKDVLKCMRNLHVRIRSLRQLADHNNYRSPIIFVIGPEYVGKTAVCNFLLNKALEDKMEPVYVDLDVCRNVSTIPGTISIHEIQRVDSSSPTAFEYYAQSKLQFGSTNFTGSNIQLYLRLVRKISDLLDECQSQNSECYAGAIIDMCGTLGKDTETIKSILNLFSIELVVVVGDESYYAFIKNSLLTVTKTEFVPQPRRIKVQHKNWATKAYNAGVLKYFYGKNMRWAETFSANFSDFKVYRFNEDHFIRTSNNYRINHTEVNLSAGEIECNPSIGKYILGVVRPHMTYEELAVAEIDYFVCFANVNTQEKYVTIISPVTEHFKEKILLLSKVRLPQREEGEYQGFQKYVFRKGSTR